ALRTRGDRAGALRRAQARAAVGPAADARARHDRRAPPLEGALRRGGRADAASAARLQPLRPRALLLAAARGAASRGAAVREPGRRARPERGPAPALPRRGRPRLAAARSGERRGPRARPRPPRARPLRARLRFRGRLPRAARELALMIPAMRKGKREASGPGKGRATRLLVEERRRRILELLDDQERVTVEELVARFSVSAVTIRGDLDALADLGAVVRSHGGALKRGDAPEDVPITVKETLHHAEKVRIGHAAAQMIQDGETIMLDSGTTTAEIARQIRFLRLRSLNVITNALNIAMELANLPHIRLIMIGGVLRQMSYSLAGPHAEHTLRGLNADRLFLGVDGLDPEIGLMTPDVVEAQLNAVMIQVSREVIVVADASKFQRRSLSVIAKLDAVHKVITDGGAGPEVLTALRAR